MFAVKDAGGSETAEMKYGPIRVTQITAFPDNDIHRVRE